MSRHNRQEHGSWALIVHSRKPPDKAMPMFAEISSVSAAHLFKHLEVLIMGRDLFRLRWNDSDKITGKQYFPFASLSKDLFYISDSDLRYRETAWLSTLSSPSPMSAVRWTTLDCWPTEFPEQKIFQITRRALAKVLFRVSRLHYLCFPRGTWALLFADSLLLPLSGSIMAFNELCLETDFALIKVIAVSKKTRDLAWLIHPGVFSFSFNAAMKGKDLKENFGRGK